MTEKDNGNKAINEYLRQTVDNDHEINGGGCKRHSDSTQSHQGDSSCSYRDKQIVSDIDYVFARIVNGGKRKKVEGM